MNTSGDNPYAPPVDPSSGPLAVDSSLFFREAEFLVVREGAELPDVCMVSNGAVDGGGWRRRVTISWSPPWIYFTVLLGLLVMVVLLLVFQKKAKITYSLSKESWSTVVRKRAIGFVLICVAVGLGFAAFDDSIPSDFSGACGIGAVLAVILALIAFVVSNPIKVVKHHDGWFRIKGCSRDFLDGLPVADSAV